MPLRRAILPILTAALTAAVVGMPGFAVAAATDYDLSVTMPSIGKSGCMVCHGDRNLIRFKGDRVVSYWIDETMMSQSAHQRILCTGCHIDFAYKLPHKATGDWRNTAKLACKNCHKEEFQAYGIGVHGLNTKPGAEGGNAAAKPLCGDCHGAHDIERLKGDDGRPVKAARLHLHERGSEVCGKCHEAEWASYSDYYHGAAYRAGAPDAPACWDCHGSHDILPSADRRSMVHPTQLQNTCEQCHKDVNEGYLDYTRMVHRRQQALESNPLYNLLKLTKRGISGMFSGLFGVVRSWFG